MEGREDPVSSTRPKRANLFNVGKMKAQERKGRKQEGVSQN
jgi:hypothetical protein